MKKKTKTQKKEYVPPKVKVTLIEMEQGIAAGSARVTPVSAGGQVEQEWETGTDRDTTINF
ncbi:hypothetical protein [Elizabethkingia anophelis]|uniref:hypothetical protein n=1 Tax=Elizabethkingia anophelis TaxID=1117645 RepID=UPI003891F232